MVKAEGYKAQVFRYTETENVVHIETDKGKVIKVLIPVEMPVSDEDCKLPFGLNFVTEGHYI